MSVEEFSDGVAPLGSAASGRSASAGTGSATGRTGSAAAVLAALTAAVDELAAAADPTSPRGRLEGAAAVDVVREALGLAGRGQESLDAVGDRLRDPAAVSRHHSQPAGHRLDDCVWDSLGDAGVQEHIAGLEAASDLH